MARGALFFDEAARHTARDGIVHSLNRRRHNSCNCGTRGPRHSFAAFRGIERARTCTPINSRRTMGTREDNCAWGRGHSRKRKPTRPSAERFPRGENNVSPFRCRPFLYARHFASWQEQSCISASLLPYVIRSDFLLSVRRPRPRAARRYLGERTRAMPRNTVCRARSRGGILCKLPSDRVWRTRN